jgi:hypothetical protein
MAEKYIQNLKEAFKKSSKPARIPTLNRGIKKKGYFTAELASVGIKVDNLGNQPILPLDVFRETINLLIEKGGEALKGKCHGKKIKLGDPELPLDSIEGKIAYKVYHCKIGDSVFRRITPVSCILAWAGICKNKRGYLELISSD